MTSVPALASPHRLAIVLSHPTQYYSPWFRWLHSETPLVFRVFYLWEFGVTPHHDRQFNATFSWDVDLRSGYDHEFVPNVAYEPGTHHFHGLHNPTLPARLTDWHPTAVLFFGYNWSSHVRAIVSTRLRRVPLLFRGDSHLLGRGAPRLGARLALRALYAQFAALLPVGAANRDYFLALGVSEQKLFSCPHSVSRQLFDPSQQQHRSAAAALRQHLGLATSTRVVLFAGKLVAAKQPRELLSAFLSLQLKDVALVFVGDGPEKAALLELVRQSPAGAVHFLPFANQTEMPARYLLADLFVLPSRGHYETWGLAVNEAMLLGVPALVSDLVGCQRDLVTDGETGWVFSSTQPNDLAGKLSLALATLADATSRARIRANVAARIAHYTYAETTAGLLAALASIPATKRK